MSVFSSAWQALAVARPANTQCVDARCPGSTDAPTFALIALLAVGLLSIVLAVRMWRRGRRSRDAVFGAATAVLAGVAVLCLVLFGSGFRQYGTGANGTTCSAWWQEAGLPAAAQGVGGDPGGVNCRARAVDAIGPALGEGGVAGVVVGAVVFAVFGYSGRRGSARPERPRYAYSDLAADAQPPGAASSRSHERDREQP